MGTHHWWRVLLLGAALVGSTRADNCAALPPTLCPVSSTPEFHECKSLAGPVSGSMKCTPGDELFLDKTGSGTGPWTKGFKSVDCAVGKWTAMGTLAKDNFDFNMAKTKIVCAKPGAASGPTPLPDCQQCAPMAKADCKSTEGCTEGATLPPSVVAGCSHLQCGGGEFFISPEVPGKIDEIKCNQNKEWKYLGSTITKAVCITGYSCKAKASLPNSNCNDAKYIFKDCDPVTASDDNDIKCKQGKFMYYRTDASDVWTKNADPLHEEHLYCDKTTGFWQSGQTALSSSHHVVCASADPKRKIDCTSPPTDCARTDVHPKAVCTPASISSSSVSCTSGSLYVKYAGEYEQSVDPITCNLGEGKWKRGGAPFSDAGLDNIICAEKKPNIK